MVDASDPLQIVVREPGGGHDRRVARVWRRGAEEPAEAVISPLFKNVRALEARGASEDDATVVVEIGHGAAGSGSSRARPVSAQLDAGLCVTDRRVHTGSRSRPKGSDGRPLRVTRFDEAPEIVKALMHGEDSVRVRNCCDGAEATVELQMHRLI